MPPLQLSGPVLSSGGGGGAVVLPLSPPLHPAPISAMTRRTNCLLREIKLPGSTLRFKFRLRCYAIGHMTEKRGSQVRSRTLPEISQDRHRSGSGLPLHAASRIIGAPQSYGFDSLSIKALCFKAGPSAFKDVKTHGFAEERIGTIAGASGGAKWLVLSQLDRVITERILPKLSAPVHLLGSSIGAWRFCCYAQPSPKEAIERFESAYIDQKYSEKPDAAEISGKSREILQELLGATGPQEIVNPPGVSYAHHDRAQPPPDNQRPATISRQRTAGRGRLEFCHSKIPWRFLRPQSVLRSAGFAAFL